MRWEYTFIEGWRHANDRSRQKWFRDTEKRPQNNPPRPGEDFTVDPFLDGMTPIEALNELGRDGWELVSLTFDDARPPNICRDYLKRPL
jgi:hypothetical protein